MDLDNGLGPIRPQAIIWASADPIQWRIYAALDGDELTHWGVLVFYEERFFNEKQWKKILVYCFIS